MSDPVCLACENKGWETYCPLCARSSTPRLRFDEKMRQDVNEAHTAPPDELDEYWGALARMDNDKELNKAQDELIKNGATYSFLALCVKLLPLIILFVLVRWAV